MFKFFFTDILFVTSEIFKNLRTYFLNSSIFIHFHPTSSRNQFAARALAIARHIKKTIKRILIIPTPIYRKVRGSVSEIKSISNYLMYHISFFKYMILYAYLFQIEIGIVWFCFWSASILEWPLDTFTCQSAGHCCFTRLNLRKMGPY